MIRTHNDILNHVTNYCQARKSDYRDIIRSIAQPKGLEKRVVEEQAYVFLNGSLVFPFCLLPDPHATSRITSFQVISLQ